MAYKLQLKRGLLASLPNGSVGEPLFTTDTFDLYVGKGDGSNIKLQKFIASGSSSQFLKGDGSLDSTTYQGVLSGSGIVKSTGGTISYLTDNSSNWDAAYNDKINSASVSGTTTKTLTLTQQDGGTITASWSDYDTAPVTSVFGRTGAVVAASGDYTTSLVTEGTNLYFTDARARAAITLTTTGSSGSATYVGGTLNVPTYTLSGLGGVPTSRSLTINGTSYDLSADRSWSVGTVTSVDLSVPTGFAISGNPITSSGTLALAFATGYSLPTNASQTNWDAAYNDKINSASVTGTTTKTLTLNQQDGGTITASWTDINTDAVTSVFGRTGAVVAASGDYTTTQVTEGTNLYYTEARVSANSDVAANTAARHSAVTLGTANGLSLSTQQLSLALASGSTTGALSSTDWTTFNSKQAALNGTGFVKISGTTISYDNSTYYLASNPSSYIAKTDLSAITPLSYDNTTGVFQMSQANSTTSGYITSTDWNTFNNKQSALTNPVTGTGTTNYLPKFTGSTTIGNSSIQDGTSSVTYTYSTNPIFNVTDGTNTTRLGVATTAGAYVDIAKANDGFIRVKNGLAIGTSDGFYGTYFDVNGNLGLGTNNPVVKLELIGNYRQKALVGNSNGFNISINSSTDVVSLINYYNAGLVFGVNNAERMRLTSTGLGIGTTSPSVKLDVVGAGMFSSTLTVKSFLYLGESLVENGVINSPEGIFINADSDASGGSNDIVFGKGRTSTSGGTTLMTLKNNGNLGLGVSPSAWSGLSGKVLEVGTAFGDKAALFQNDIDDLRLTSNVYFDGSFRYVRSGTATIFHSSNGSYKWNIAGSGTAGNAISFTQAMTLDASGNLQLGTTTGTSRATIAVANAVSTARTPLVLTDENQASLSFVLHTELARINTGGSDDLAFGTNNSERLRITSGGSLLVGCTTAPTAIGVSDLLVIGKSGSASNAINFSNGSTTNWGYLLAESGKMVLGSGASSNITFETNAGSERMRITSGGNVGIGTSSPSDKLTVKAGNGNQLTLDNTGERFTQISFLNNGGGIKGGLWYDSTNSLFEMYAASGIGTTFYGGGSERLRITSGGNVGIGNTSPVSALDVNGRISLGGALYTNVAQTESSAGTLASGYNFNLNNASPVHQATGSMAGVWYNTGTIQFYTNSSQSANTSASERMRITSGGNIGIGLTNPGAKLEILGTSSDQLRLSTAATEHYRIGRNASTGYLDFYGSQTGYSGYTFGGVDGTRLTIDSTGAATFSSTIKTAAPTGYSAQPWKLGDATSGTLTPNYYIKVEINGQIYSIPALQGTP